MQIDRRISRALSIPTPSVLSPVVAYDEDTRLFYLRGDQKTEGIAVTWACVPMAGIDEATLTTLRDLLNAKYPDDAMMQITLINSNYIDDTLERYRSQRARHLSKTAKNILSPQQKEVLRLYTAARIKQLRQGAAEPLYPEGVPLRRTMLLISLRWDRQLSLLERLAGRHGDLSRADVVDFSEVAQMVENKLANAHLNPHRLDAREYLGYVRSILRMGDSPEEPYDDTQPLNEQIHNGQDEVSISEDFSQINDRFVSTVSVDKWPSERFNISVVMRMIGDTFSSGRQITYPFVMSMAVHFPNRVAAKTAFKTKLFLSVRNAEGPIAKFDSRLVEKARGSQELERVLADSEQGIIKVWHSTAVFADSEAQIRKASEQVRAHFAALGVTAYVDKYRTLPFLSMILPMGANALAARSTQVYKTMAPVHAAHLVPIFGDYLGNAPGEPVQLYSTVRGNLLGLDLFTTGSASNFVVGAQTGAGKSFCLQHMCLENLAVGRREIVLDIGGSFLGMCEALGGTYVDFGAGDHIYNLDPFAGIKDKAALDESLDSLIEVVKVMAMPNDPASDKLKAEIRSAIVEAFNVASEASASDKEVDFQFAHVFEAIRANKHTAHLLSGLAPYRPGGEYAQWFDPQTPRFEFDNALTVLELKRLESFGRLQALVMLLIFFKIEALVYNSWRNGEEKIQLLCDEAWKLIQKHPDFFNQFARQCRKHGGAIGVVVQSLTDLAGPREYAGIWENLSFRFVLKQKSDVVPRLKESGVMGIDDYGYELMRKVHTVRGHYSDIFVQFDDDAYAVARLVPPKWLFNLLSTESQLRSELAELMRTYNLTRIQACFFKAGEAHLLPQSMTIDPGLLEQLERAA